MKKQVMFITLIALYFVGMIAAMFIIIKGGTHKSETSRESFVSSISMLTKKNKKESAIGVIRIDAPIFFDNESSSLLRQQPKGASHWLEQMNFAATNDRIKAVILRMNTPGGTVGASQELYEAVKRIRIAGKPVIASVADLSASGGYYIMSAADYIFANPGSLVGSIGVILGGVEFTGLLSKLGIKYQAVTSGPNKDILSPYKALSREQRRLLQDMVDNTYEQFLTAVSKGRRKNKEKMRPLADGSVYTGEMSVKNGLVDALGSFNDVENYVRKTYNLADADIELINPSTGGFDLGNFISVFTPMSPQINLLDKEPKYGYSPVLYLYQF